MIRRVTLDDIDDYREVRLRALQDSPSAFGSTYAGEAVQPPEYWQARTQNAAAGSERAMFLAYDGDECVGMAGCVDDDLGANKQLISMWVAPSRRGTGVADGLIDAVLAWAEQSGARRIGLWVTRGNDRALRCYERAGFRVTGDVQPLPSDPCKEEIRMVRDATAAVDARESVL